MPDRTGRALGSLEPIIFFERPDGYVILPPEEIGKPGIARMMYEKKYRAEGWEWREADTLPEVDKLQKRLVDQEMKVMQERDLREDLMRQRAYQKTGERLRQRLTSGKCSAYEREFISLYLQSREDKRDKHRQRWTEAQMYLWAREQDSGTKVTDRMKGENSI